MTWNLWLTALSAGCALATASVAQVVAPAPVRGSVPVLELFTSQGCSSCPPADVVFKGYAARRDIVALSMPVDYWDYLGWKDTLANAKFSQRQRTYARARGDGQVYTPQVIVNGRRHYVGSSKFEIDKAVVSSLDETTPVAVKASFNKGMIEIDLSSTGVVGPDMTVWLAVVQPEAQVDVRAGENRGHKLTYFNVVRDLVPAGMWSGTATTIRHQASTLTSHSGDRFAVIVQNGTGGALVAGAWIDPT